MDENEIKNDLEKLSNLIWNWRSLSVIYHNVVREGDNIKGCHIDTLGTILCKHAEETFQCFIDFEQKI